MADACKHTSSCGTRGTAGRPECMLCSILRTNGGFKDSEDQQCTKSCGSSSSCWQLSRHARPALTFSRGTRCWKCFWTMPCALNHTRWQQHARPIHRRVVFPATKHHPTACPTHWISHVKEVNINMPPSVSNCASCRMPHCGRYPEQEKPSGSLISQYPRLILIQDRSWPQETSFWCLHGEQVATAQGHPLQLRLSILAFVFNGHPGSRE